MKLASAVGKPPNGGGGELHHSCTEILQQILKLTGADLASYLEQAEWPPNAPKSEMQRWSPVLNKFDLIMECAQREEGEGRKVVDLVPDVKFLVMQVLRFSWIIYENTFSRSVYSSIDRLIEFLDSEDIRLVTKTLAFLLTISKRSRFISQMPKDLKKQLSQRLFAMVLCWDGKMSGVKMNEVCDPNFTCKYFPIHMNLKAKRKATIHEPDFEAISLYQVWHEIDMMGPLDDERHLIRAGVRMAYALRNYEERIHIVIGRLMAFSVLAYSRICTENATVLSYLKTTLVDDIGEILHRDENFENSLVDKLKGEALRTLTSIVLIDKQCKSRLRPIIEATGAHTYHGYVSVVTRICVDDLKTNLIGTPHHMSTHFATALFSLLYHIAGNDLPINSRLTQQNNTLSLSTGIMDSLLDVISCDSIAAENIGFLTRAIRVIDIITASDANGFDTAAGVQAAVNRFVLEINTCKGLYSGHTTADPCNHQRAALIKSLLNFLKQSVSDTHFADACRPMMDGELPEAIIEILNNAYFYGASLFYNAVCLITSFVYQEPTKLTMLQDKGICDAVMRGIFRHETPISRDMIAHIPNTLSALCLNERGLENVKNFKPFDKIFGIILSTKFMTISKKKKNGIADSAPSLGNSFEELLRHQPSLRGDLYRALTDAIDHVREIAENTNNKLVYSAATAIAIKNGEIELDDDSTTSLESDPGARAPFATRARLAASRSRRNMRSGLNSNVLSDDEDDDEEDCNLDTTTNETLPSNESSSEDVQIQCAEGFSVGDVCVVPIGEYATYMCRSIETMLCPQVNSENARLFIDLGLVQKLIKLLSTRRACVEMYQNGLHLTVSNIVRTLLLNGYNTTVMEEVLKELSEVTSACSNYDNENEEVEIKISDEQSGAFLISSNKENYKTAVEDICAVGSVTQVLTSIIKRSLISGQISDIRALLMKHFINSQYGKPCMQNLAKWFRLLTWELCAWQNKVLETKEERLESKKMKKAKETNKESPVTPLVVEKESVVISSEQVTVLGLLSKVQKTVAEIQFTIVTTITDNSQLRFLEKMTSDCPAAYILIDETLKSMVASLQWQGMRPVPLTLNAFRAAIIEFLKILFYTQQTSSNILATVARFYIGGYYKQFCDSLNDMALSFDSPGVIHLIEAWIGLVTIMNNYKHGKQAMKIPKQNVFMYGCEKVDIKTFLYEFRSTTFNCLTTMYTAINDRHKTVDLPYKQARLLSRCLLLYTEILHGLHDICKSAEEKKKVNKDISMLAVTEQTVALNEMGFSDKHANIAQRIFGKVDTSASFLAQYTESKPARLPPVEEIRRMKKEKENKKKDPVKAEKEKDKSPKEKKTKIAVAASDDVMVLLSRSCDLVVQMYLTMAEQHSFLLVGITNFLEVVLSNFDGSVQRRYVKEVLVQKMFDLIDETVGDAHPEDITGKKLVMHMQLLCFLWPSLPTATMAYALEEPMVEKIMQLFTFFQCHPKASMFSKIMSCLTLLLELIEKTAVFENRRKMYCQNVGGARWKYWNLVSEGFGSDGRKSGWLPFSKDFSDQLDQRYRLGCEVWKDAKMGDRTIPINFTEMVYTGAFGHEYPISVDITLKKSMDLKNSFTTDYDSIFCGEDKRFLLDGCLHLLDTEKDLDSDCIHSLLALIARLTKDFSIIPYFLKERGLEKIFALKCQKSVSLSPVFVTLIIAHCMDDEAMLAQSFEKVVKNTLRGTVTTSHGLQGFANRWFAKAAHSSRMKDWVHAIHLFTPMGSRDPQLFGRVLSKATNKNGEQMEPTEGGYSADLMMQQSYTSFTDEVVAIMLEYTLKFNSTDDEQLLITRSFMLRSLAEIAKNYSCVASSIVDLHEQHDIFTPLIKLAVNLESRTVCVASRAFLMTIASCVHSPRAQKALVSAIQCSIRSFANGQDPKKAAEEIQEIANLILQLRDACPPNPNVTPENVERQGNHNVMFWHIVESGILNDLVNCVWYVKGCDKEAITKMASSIVRTLEEITRFSNFLKKHDAEMTKTAAEAAAALEAVEAALNLDLDHHDDDLDLIGDDEQPPVFYHDHPELDLRDMAHHEEIQLGMPDEDDELDDEDGENDEDDEDNDDDDDDNEDDEEMEALQGPHEPWFGADGLDEDEEDGVLDLVDEMDTGDDDLSRVDEVLEEVLHDMQRDEMENGGYDGGRSIFVLDALDTPSPPPNEHFLRSTNSIFATTNRGISSLNEFVSNGLGDMQLLYSRGVGVHSIANDFVSTYNSADRDLPFHSNPVFRQTMPRSPESNTLFDSIRIDSRALSPEWLLSRAVFEPSQVGRGRRGGPGGLQRQNAVRRYPTASQSMFSSSLFDAPDGGPPYTYTAHEFRSGRYVPVRDEAHQRRKNKLCAIPTAMDRFIDASRLFDSKSLTYVFNLLCAHYIEEPLRSGTTRFWALSGEDRRAAALERKESVEATVKTDGDDDDDEEEDDDDDNDNEHNRFFEEFELEEEDNATSEDVLVSLERIEEEEELNALFPVVRSEQISATMESAPIDEPSATTVSVTSSASNRSSASVVDRPGPSNLSQRLDEELRQILGDLQIPEGVDPAFLAALPEDMRREVVRDHLRQQDRATSENQPLSGPTVVPSLGFEGRNRRPENTAIVVDGESVPGDNTVTANEEDPAVPPLDQEFLAALPPDLQQELIEQHERDVRLAREARNPPEAPSREEPVDPAALLESLPPSLRAQVLADADDSVIQVLPPNMADEARRLRANLEHQQAMRYARMMHPRSHFPRSLNTYGRQEDQFRNGSGETPTLNTVQFLNSKSLTTVVLFLLLDDGKAQANSQFPMGKLLKLIRNLCTYAPSCDYVILALTQFMQCFPNSNIGEEVSDTMRYDTWLERLTQDCGMGRQKKLVQFPEGKNTAFVNKRALPGCAKNVLDALQNIARAYPTQFLPQLMRSKTDDTNDFKPPTVNFYEMTRKVNSLSEDNLDDLHQYEYTTFSEAPIASILAGLGGDWLQKGNAVHERLLRACYLVFHKIPDDALYDKSPEELEKSLSSVVKIITEQLCSNDALNDGRMLLAESARAFGDDARECIFKLVMRSIETIGLELLPQLLILQEELIKYCALEEELAAKECEEGQSTAIKLTSMKLFKQKQLLKALESLVSIKSTVKNMEKQKAKNKKVAEAKKAALPVQDSSGSSASAASSSNANENLGAYRPFGADAGLRPFGADAGMQPYDPIEDLPRVPSDDPGQQQQEHALVPNESGQDKDQNDESDITEPFTVEIYDTLSNLKDLWVVLSSCLTKLELFSGQKAVATLQPATEAFFLVHTPSELPDDLSEYLKKHSLSEPNLASLHEFAESHRLVLNQILRISGSQLMEAGGSFRVLMLFPKLLDFDVKRKFFRKEIHRRERDDRTYLRRDDVGIRIRRSHMFSDSFRELFRVRPHDWKSRFYVVFEGEEGQDAGGLLREWFSIITREIFNPNYALFAAAPGDRATYMINKASYINPEHLDYFKFVGKIIAKAIYENKLLDCYFTRAFYKHILNLPVRYQDIESEDPSYYKSLEFLLTNPVEHVAELTFSVDVDEFGVVSRRQLKEEGSSLAVTDENKGEYVQLVCQMKMTGSIRKQLDAFLEGFYEIIPKQLISIFNEQELELLISGLPMIDIDDLCANTEYKTYTKSSPQIQWFWRALRSFEREDLAKFLQFVTGTSKVPLGGFSTLEGMNGVQKFSIHCDFRSNDRLPAAHTCFNQLDLPQYDSYDKLYAMLLMAIRECTEGFGFA